jgi:ATP-dependent DNA helicase RecQ
LVELKLSVDEIAQRRSLASSTVAGQIERLVQDGAALDLDHLMPPPERMETIKAAFLRTGDVRLAPVRESLGDGYSYDEIRMVRIALFPNGVIVPEHAE